MKIQKIFSPVNLTMISSPFHRVVVIQSVPPCRENLGRVNTALMSIIQAWLFVLFAVALPSSRAEKILKWIDDNVSREASRDEEFAQRLTRLFLEFVAARTKSIEHDKVLPPPPTLE